MRISCTPEYLSEAAAAVLFMGTMNEEGGMEERKGVEGKGREKGMVEGKETKRKSEGGRGGNKEKE